MVALSRINLSTYWFGAALVMLFSWWDWFVDPAHWSQAFAIRCVGSAFIIASGIVQRISGRVDWAARLAQMRYSAGVITVAAAIAVLDRGFLLGIAGLLAVLMGGPYMALDRRHLVAMNVVPLLVVGVIMYVAGLDRFTIVNSSIFIALALAVSLMLARVFEAANRRAFALEQQLTREARTDALTGLLNRRALDEIAARELERSARKGAPLAVLLCDVDHFKAINDAHGHAAGDRAIKAIAERLHAELRASDAFGRWGGEEFLAILPDTDANAAQVLAERMRTAVEESPIMVGPALHVTLSIGVAGHMPVAQPAPAGAWEALVKAADEALYDAKAGGRNRTVVAD
jgi:diguanylate cyclase (GGDEF)-like protein